MRFSFPPHLHRYCQGDFTAFDILVRLIRMPQLWHSRTYLTVSFRSGPLSSSSSWTVLSMEYPNASFTCAAWLFHRFP